MSVGLAVTKSEIDTRVGDLARNFQRNFDQIDTIKAYLDATPDSDLITLGYSQGEVTTLKTAVNDFAQLAAIWRGITPLLIQKDFTTFIRRLWGVGAF